MFWRPLPRPRAERLRLAIEHLGPIFVKFGQVLSTRRDILPPDMAEELSKLQDSVPAQPFAEIQSVMERSYGRPVGEVFSTIEHEPLGSASVAQVHRAELLDGTEVAVKVLRPNIDRQVDRDIALMDSFAWLVEATLKDGKRLRPRAIVAEFHNSLREETNLLHEAANCTQLGRNFEGHQMMVTPKVHWDQCTDTVMVMELLQGVPVDQVDDLRAANVDLAKLARSGIEIFFTQVFRDSFFHADMHPGNLMVDDKGRFIVLDYGIMGSLSDHDKEYIGANFLAFFNRDYRKVALMHIAAGWTPEDTSVPQFEAAIRAVCEPVFSRPLQEISFARLLLQLFKVARRFNVTVQPQLMLLQKTLFNIEGLGRQLAPQLNLWESAKPYLENWAKEQYSARRALASLGENAPAVAAMIPELPMAMRSALRRIRSGEQESLRRDIDQLQRTNRRLWALFAVAVVAFILAG